MLPVSAELALKLVSIFEGYFTIEEFRELVAMFDVKLESLDNWEPKWLPITRELTTKLEYGNSRLLVDSLLEFANSRNTDGYCPHFLGDSAFSSENGPRNSRGTEAP
jgi:hypothetical protein